MKLSSLFLPLVTIIALFAGAGSVRSGELSPGLEQQLAGKSASERVPVWIMLPPVIDNPRAFRAELRATHDTRAGRYRAALGRFQEEHPKRQEALVRQLQVMSARGEAAKIRPHWIVNMVEAEVNAGQLRALAARPDIDMIYTVPELKLVDPIQQLSPAAPVLDTLTDNITFVRADEAWAMGYTGADRLICSFDTGVEGDHPALIENWKGHDGDSAAAWFDPLDGESFPHLFFDSHGTHVMGIMVGRDNSTGDTVGVAPGARWISAGVVDIPGAPIIFAFEWAANPDGDPNTIADVPDVINHSWGIPDAGCVDVFYSVIDNVEALGIVNIFAAGNEGTALSSIRNPANRANDSLDCFAVGNLNHRTNPPAIAGSSSRGPSDCNGAIKPNVAAPGNAIWSSIGAGNYGYLGGTSMAAPHVSGLVALLREKNPNATVDEIKDAILNSAPDFGYSLPDNTYGWGIVDFVAALNRLSNTNLLPNVRVYDLDRPTITPGATVTGEVVLQNVGASVSGVTGTITGSHPSLTVIDGSVSFGTVGSNDTVRSSDDLTVVVSDTVSEGSVLGIDFEINGSGYSKQTKLFFVVDPIQGRSLYTHDANNISFTITNYGSFGLGPGSLYPANGTGFRFNESLNEIWEAGLMIGTAFGVSDGARSASGEPDGDFAVAPGGNFQISAPGDVAAQQTVSLMTDSLAEAPLGLQVMQRSYGFTESGYEDFVILQYIITNVDNLTLPDFHVGLYFDWDIISYGSNAGGWNSVDSIGWIAYNDGGSLSDYRGVKLLDKPATTSFTAFAEAFTYYPPNGDGFTESEKFAALSSGFSTATTYVNSSLDLMSVVSAGPFTLNPGEVNTVSFAVVAGVTEAEMIEAADSASRRFDGVVQYCCEGIRGNVNWDDGEVINVSDLTVLIDILFRGEYIFCNGETNIDGNSAGVNVSDLTYLIDFLFRGGPEPASCF